MNDWPISGAPRVRRECFRLRKCEQLHEESRSDGTLGRGGDRPSSSEPARTVCYAPGMAETANGEHCGSCRFRVPRERRFECHRFPPPARMTGRPLRSANGAASGRAPAPAKTTPAMAKTTATYRRAGLRGAAATPRGKPGLPAGEIRSGCRCPSSFMARSLPSGPVEGRPARLAALHVRAGTGRCSRV